LAAITPPRPCHSMAWSGGIWIIYIVNLLANKRALTERVNRLCAWCCTQHLTHTRSGKRHDEPTIGWLRVLRSLDSEMSVIVAALTLASQMAGFGRPMCLSLGLIRAVGGRKLHLQFLRAIPLFTFTHDSCVMSTIFVSLLCIHFFWWFYWHGPHKKWANAQMHK